MAADDRALGRNIFDAFLTLLKTEKEDDTVSSTDKFVKSADSESTCTTTATSHSASPWIKPEGEVSLSLLSHSPTTVSPTATVLQAHPSPDFQSPDHPHSSVTDPTPLSGSSSLNYSSVSLNLAEPNNPSSVCNFSTVSSLQISSVSHRPPTVHTPVSIPPSTLPNGNLAVRISNAITLCVSSTSASITSDPILTSGITPSLSAAPVSDLLAHASRFNLSFGCLDDLIPLDDPVRSAYINFKCSQLRYPLPLAVAMSKLYDPSKFPLIPSTSPKAALTPTSFLTRNSPFAKSRRPDQGFLEIDASHFTLTPSANSFSSNVSVSTPPPIVKPRTKAQLRNLYRGDDGHSEPVHITTELNNSRQTVQNAPEFPGSRNSVRRSQSRCRRSSALRGRRLSGSTHSDTLPSTHRRMQDHRTECLTSPIPESPATSSASVSRLHGVSQCAASPDSLPVIVVDDEQEGDQKNGTDIQSLSDSAPFSDPFNIEAADEGEALTSLVSSINFNGKSLTFDDLAVVTLSSQDLTPNLDSKFSRLPHLISLQLPCDRVPRSSCYLLLGDVARIICLLESSPSSAFCLGPLLRHCRRSKYLFWVRHLCMRLPTHTLPLGSLTVDQRGFNWSNPQSKQQLFLIAWPSNSLVDNALTLASSQLPLQFNWRSSASKFSVMKAVSTILVDGPVRRAVSSQKNLKRLLTSVESFTDPSPSAVATNYSNPLKDNITDTNYPDAWAAYLPTSFWSQKISQAFMKHEIAGYGLIVGYLRILCKALFVDREARMTPELAFQSGFVDPNASTNLFTCMFDLHVILSESLRSLRDSYASLISAGSCLTARYSLSVTSGVETESLRIERGRARLFPTDGAARLNITRILNDVIHPTLHKLFIKIDAVSKMLSFIISNERLLGPFTPTKTGTAISNYEITRERMMSVLAEGPKNVIMTESKYSGFFHLCYRTFDCLDKSLAPYIRGLLSDLNVFKTRFGTTKKTLTLSWIPVYANALPSIDMRASEDLKFLASILQSQYDVLEVWIRVQHNSIIPMIGQRLLELFHALFSADDGVPNLWDWRLPNTRLYSPYGSKNTEELKIRTKPTACISLPEWPPIIITRTDRVFTTTRPSETPPTCVSLLGNEGPSAVQSQSPMNTYTAVPQPSQNSVSAERASSDADCVMFEPGDPISSHRNEIIGNSSSTKRICIYVPEQSDGEFIFSTSVRSDNTEDEISEQHSPLDETMLTDRRRLGKLKRRMKMTNSASMDRANYELEQIGSTGFENTQLGSPTSIICLDAVPSPEPQCSQQNALHDVPVTTESNALLDQDVSSTILHTDSAVHTVSTCDLLPPKNVISSDTAPSLSRPSTPIFPNSEPSSTVPQVINASTSCPDKTVSCAAVSLLRNADIAICDASSDSSRLKSTDYSTPIPASDAELESLTSGTLDSDPSKRCDSSKDCPSFSQMCESCEPVLPVVQSKSTLMDKVCTSQGSPGWSSAVSATSSVSFNGTNNESLQSEARDEETALPELSSAVSAASIVPDSTNVIGGDLSNLTIEKVAADLHNISPWLREHLRSYKAPGPVTAAILAQASSPHLHSAISIDLTSDD